MSEQTTPAGQRWTRHQIVLSGMWGDVHQARWFCGQCYRSWKDDSYKWVPCEVTPVDDSPHEATE